jgi:3-deoxy-manno-octulosonate cytidylyltransferase (CMP-KDO synthetase)
MRTYVVIPARKASTRLPNKMLLRSTGQSLIQHTFEAASAASKPIGVLVATDHQEIYSEVLGFGGRAVLTSPDCASGTDRVAEVAQTLKDADILVNLQGDEPEIAPADIDRVIELLEENPAEPMATLATPIQNQDQIYDPSCVKVVCDCRQRALYFSRSPIPYVRDELPVDSYGESLFHQHIGLYAYRRTFLLELAATPPSPLEQAEKLEQLRVLQMGKTICVGIVEHVAQGIDTPSDYANFVSRTLRRAG